AAVCTPAQPAWGDAPGAAASAAPVRHQPAPPPERGDPASGDAAGNATHRTVAPHRVVMLGRRWYLAAWDLTRHDWRTLRLDRITAPSPTGRRYPPREVPTGDPASYVRQSVSGAATPTHEVAAVVEATASEVANRIGRWATAEPIDELSCRVHMTTDNLAWPIMALGSLGADFQVETPE